MTPKQLKRSNNKTGFNDADCENDFSAAFSSGKNSRRKSSVIRAQLMREQHEEDGFMSNMRQGSDAKRHLFESNQKKASSTLRCLFDNETENGGYSSNAPRKGARYL